MVLEKFRRRKVILIPDDHSEWKDLAMQLQTVQKHKPDIVLHEALNKGEDISPETKELIEKMQRFEENVEFINRKIGNKYITIMRLEDLKGTEGGDREIEQALAKIKRLHQLTSAEIKNLERMMQNKGRVTRWVQEKYQERLEMRSRLLEIQEVLSALKDPSRAGITKFAAIMATAQKHNIPVDGLEEGKAVRKHVKALKQGNGLAAIEAMREREMEMIKTILEHVNKGEKVVVVSGALHTVKLYAELRERRIPVEIINTGISPKDTREELRKRARGWTYSAYVTGGSE
ncbi:MAG: hypothetical protein GXN93_01345 [Candidatus Diapherotrites archaeon]|nr:hypothetical protein [Candidatus Diapherotrites archaeon]